MYAYWSTAETLTVETIEQVAERLEATESVVTVNQLVRQKKKHSLTKTSSISVPRIGKRFIPRGQDIEFAELDNCAKGLEQRPNIERDLKLLLVIQKCLATLKMNPMLTTISLVKK